MINHQKKTHLIFLILIYFITVISIILMVVPIKHDCINKGILDFSSYSFDKYTHYSINSKFVRIPEKDYADFESYSLTCILPKDLNEIYFCIPSSNIPFCITIDDTEFFTRTIEDCKKYAQTQVVPYHIAHKHDNNITDNAINITVQYLPKSNTPYLMNIPPLENNDFKIGSAKGIYRYLNSRLAIDLFLFASCFISFIVYLFLFTYRYKNTNYLIYSILAITYGISLLVVNQKILTYFYTDLKPQYASYILVISYSIKSIFPVYYERNTFPQYCHKKLSRIYAIFLLGSALLGFIIPAKYQLYAKNLSLILTSIYIIRIVVLAFFSYFKSNNNKALYTLYTFPFLIIATSCDNLRQFSITTMSLAAPITMIIFITLQCIVMSRDYRLAVSNITHLSQKLKDTVFEMQENRSTYISSHIKPDYLYETLDRIYTYIDRDQDKVDSLIQNLSKYLRLTLDFSDSPKIHLIKDELAFCQAFIVLSKEQHPQINFTFDTDDNLPNVNIPKYSIQQLIENSVSHAFQGTLHPIVIISVHIVNDVLEISVKDNGCGFEKKQITNILETPKLSGVIGLYYINQMLIDNYNTNITIDSIPYKSTSVSFFITEIQDNIITDEKNIYI